MAIQLLFDGTLDPSAGTLTPRFFEATGFYIDAPSISSEIEIDVFLQIYVVTQAGEVSRNLPLGKLIDGEIKLNETDTETIKPIPSEFLEAGLDMAFLFLASEAIELEVWLVKPNYSLDNRLTSIENTLQEILRAVNSETTPVSNSSTPTAAQQAFFFLQ